MSDKKPWPEVVAELRSAGLVGACETCLHHNSQQIGKCRCAQCDGACADVLADVAAPCVSCGGNGFATTMGDVAAWLHVVIGIVGWCITLPAGGGVLLTSSRPDIWVPCANTVDARTMALATAYLRAKGAP